MWLNLELLNMLDLKIFFCEVFPLHNLSEYSKCIKSIWKSSSLLKTARCVQKVYIHQVI